MTAEILTNDQREALQEIANIGMGQAGSSIAKILDTFVVLSIPKVLVLAPDKISDQIVALVGAEQISAVRQAFHSAFRGEAIVIYHHRPRADLADLMGYEGGVDEAEECELMLDMSNVLVGACLGGIAGQLEADIGFSAPSVMAEHISSGALFESVDLAMTCALFIEVNFSLESCKFACHLIVLMPEQEITVLARAVDRFIENFG